MRWLALLVLLCAEGPQEGLAATNGVRMGVPFPPGSKGLADLQAAARRLSKQTEGRVQVKFVEQRDWDSEPDACDGALLTEFALARRSPAAQAYALPLLFHSAEEAAGLRATMEAKVAGELEARGFTLITLVDLGFAYLHSKRPVETVAQWRAARLWVPPAEPEALRMAEACGIAGVPLAAPRVRAALREGAVDAVIAPPLGAIMLQWHVEITSVSDAPFLHLCGAVVLKNESLARVAAADQVRLREELALAFSSVAEDLRKQESEALAVLAQNGVERHPLGTTPEEKAEWEAWAVSVADRLVAGGFIPAGVVEEARRLLAEFRAAP